MATTGHVTKRKVTLQTLPTVIYFGMCFIKGRCDSFDVVALMGSSRSWRSLLSRFSSSIKGAAETLAFIFISFQTASIFHFSLT